MIIFITLLISYLLNVQYQSFSTTVVKILRTLFLVFGTVIYTIIPLLVLSFRHCLTCSLTAR